ncbi:MAG: pilus assembly protein FimV [Bermanella sp.]|jgi:pilus assembly protein FimV
MLRKLAIAIAASGAMMSASTTYALGMGDIELDSALNQPLDARIKLLKASELEDWELKPNLASRDEFEKSGVERVFFLNSFRFEIERTESDVFINITSEQPVVEPFLNFLVQVDWPSGRLLREYTVLLDPPVFTEEPLSSVSAPKSEVSDTESEESFSELSDSELPGMAPSQSDEDVNNSMAEAPVAQKKTTPKSPKTYAVRKNDTLWEIAIKTREDRSVSPQQAMLAIQDLNPSAFINGNINRLKKNQVLRVPTNEEILSRSFSQAVSEVAMQNQVTANRKAQLDATRKDKAMERDNVAPDARLKLLAGGDATTEINRGASGKVDNKAIGDQSSLENDLNLALENLDKSNLENNDLRTRLDSLEDQINTLQRLVNLKDEQMVALQTGIGSKDLKLAEVDLPVKVIDEPAAVDTATEDLNFSEPAVETPTADLAPVETEVKPLAPKPFTMPIVEDQPFDVLSFVSENPQIPGAIIVALLAGLLLSSRIRKRKEEADDPLDGTVFDGQDPLSDANADLGDDFQSEFDELDLGGTTDEAEFEESDFDGADFAEDGLGDFDNSDPSLPDSLDGTDLGEGQDVLGEVDVYMAYNRVEPARELLEKTLQQQPGRMDLRVKLLEVLSEMDEQSAFDDNYSYVMENGQPSDQSQAEAIKAAYGSTNSSDFSGDFGLGLEADDSVDNLGLDLDVGESQIDAGDLDFNLEGLDLDADQAVPVEVNGIQDFEVDSSLDFDMDLSDFDSDTQNNLDTKPVLDKTIDPADDSLDFDGSIDDELATLDLGDDFEPMDLNSDLSSVELSNLDQTLDDQDLEIPNLSNELSENDLEFEGLDIPDLEVLEFDAPALDVTEDTFDIDLENDDLNSLNELDVSTPSDLDMLDEILDGSNELDLESSLESELKILGEENDLLAGDSDDLTDITDLDDDLADLERSLGGDVSEVSDLDILDELTAGADAFDAVADSNQDLVSLDELGTDDLPSLGDMDLDNLGEDLDFLSGTDESETKLDLARAYIDMDDKDGAKEILQEVLEEGTDKQKGDANKLMDSMA